jgi:pimeloyl-ACP methyl ester carboxylesterase
MTAAEWIAENDAFTSRREHRIAFRRSGGGPTVLLLHGFPTWSYDYAEVAGDLAADHEGLSVPSPAA